MIPLEVALDDLPISATQWHRLTARLALDEAHALWRLFEYIGAHGLALPADEQDRARIAGLARRRFIMVAPRLVPFFDIDEDDCWTKHSLVEWRQEKLDAKVKQKTDGRKGGLKKAENARRREEEQRQAERRAREESQDREAGELPAEFAEILGSGKCQPSVDLVPPSQTLAGQQAETSDHPLGSEVASRGLTDSSESIVEESSSVSQSVDPISATASQTPPAHPQGACDKLPASTLAAVSTSPASEHQPNPSPTLTDGKPDPAHAGLSNDEMGQLITAAGGDGLATNWPRKRTFRIVREAIAGGVDFRLDYLPEVEAFAEGARKGAKGSLQFPANTEIMAAAHARRDRRLRPPDGARALVVVRGDGAASPAEEWALPPPARNGGGGGHGGRPSAVMQAYHRIAETLDE